MVASCFVSGCDSHEETHPFVTFHRIPPKKVELYYNIANNSSVQRDIFLVTHYHYRICSRHFKLTDFKYNPRLGSRTIKAEAQPSHTPISLQAEQERSTDIHEKRLEARRKLVSKRESSSRTEGGPPAKLEKTSPVLMKCDNRPTMLSRQSAPHTITRQMTEEEEVDIESETPLHVPDVAQNIILAPEGNFTISQLPRRASIVPPQGDVTQPLVTDDPDTLDPGPYGLFSNFRQTSSPYRPGADHSYGTSCSIPVSSSGATSTTAVTTTTGVGFSGVVSSVTSGTVRCVMSSETTSAVKVEVKEVDDRHIETDYDVCDLPTEHEDEDPEDMDYSLNMSLNTTIQSIALSSEEEEVLSEVETSDTRKHIIYQSCLLQLIRQVSCSCENRGRLRNIKLSESKGSLLIVKASCRNCAKDFLWRSQPQLGRKSKGNVELATSIYVTGQTYSAAAKWMDLADIQFISKTTFYSYQHDFILPAIKEASMLSLQQARDEVNQRKAPVRLASDGRYDSPGHSARYLTYTMIDTVSGKVTHSMTLETAKCSSAVMAEKEGFIACLDSARETFSNESPLETVTTDGNLSIRSYMKEHGERLGVIHALDLWHLNKNLAKNLTKKCTNKAQKELLPWITHITNHVWWSAALCDRNQQLLKEMVFSISFHVANVHSDFIDHLLFKECRHPPITSEEHAYLPYLQPGSPALQVLTKHLHDTNFVTQLELASHGEHTGRLEVLHSMMLAYVPKRIDFDPPSYEGRIQLAFLDHNENVGRPVKLTDEGTEVLQLRWSKAVKDYRMKKIYVPKTFTFRERLMRDVLRRASAVAEETPRYTGKTIATKDKPDIAEATAAYYKYRRI